MTTTTAATAKPKPGTVKQIAECARCGETIEKVAGHSWLHAYTGSETC